MDAQAHAARALWNMLHELCLMCGRGRLPTMAYLDAEVRWARKHVEWMGVLPAQAAQQVLNDYRRAWLNCWNGTAGMPRFKARYRTALVVDVPQGRDLQVKRVHRRWGMVNIPKVGRVRFRWTKDLPGVTKDGPEGRITGARLVKDALGWHIVFRVEAVVEAATARAWADSHVGVDRGVRVPLVLSDGTVRDHAPWLTATEARRLVEYERRAARQRAVRKSGTRTSRRLEITYAKIRELRAIAKRRALDWQHKTTTALADSFALVSVEDLRVSNMVRSAKGSIGAPGRNVAQKSGLNRAIAGEAWGRTVDLLAYKLADRGGLLVKVSPANTSQRCSECGFLHPNNRESQSVFVCKNPECGWSGNADHNAGRNIDEAGLALAPPQDLWWLDTKVALSRRSKVSNPPARARRESPWGEKVNASGGAKTTPKTPIVIVGSPGTGPAWSTPWP
ncbi:RNA-guided endonuclease InsQ/TnpB family protein [Streptomyces formicae]|uniref:Transposase n=1 Tax=Streptomyces formicae TaxID=1616117 RepID=A0ABY3WXX5_9ACTN|nr:transposase [Streptomyces formicae]